MWPLLEQNKNWFIWRSVSCVQCACNCHGRHDVIYCATYYTHFLTILFYFSFYYYYYLYFAIAYPRRDRSNGHGLAGLAYKFIIYKYDFKFQLSFIIIIIMWMNVFDTILYVLHLFEPILVHFIFMQLTNYVFLIYIIICCMIVSRIRKVRASRCARMDARFFDTFDWRSVYLEIEIDIY